MKTTKILLAALCGMLCMAVFSCGTSGAASGASASAGGAVAGTWTWTETSTGKDDGDQSTCTVVVAEEVIDGKTVTTYTFSGEVSDAIQYGLAEWRATPDAETLELLKKAKTISFKMLGDGRPYRVELPIATVKDWAFHARTIYTDEDVVEEHELMILTFTQPAWGTSVGFINQSLLQHINFKTFNAGEGGIGPYSVKIWDLKLLME